MRDLDAVIEELRRFHRGTNRLLDRRMRDQGVSFARTKLLMFIEQERSARSTDIAEAFGHTPRTVTEAIDALERDGLVRRIPDPHDRRAKRISITEDGIAALRGSEPVRRAFVAGLFGALDEAEVDMFVHLLGKLNARLTESDPAPSLAKPAA